MVNNFLKIGSTNLSRSQYGINVGIIPSPDLTPFAYEITWSGD